jgi:hypothetical protein
LTCREAYTTSAAQAVVAHLVNARGLQRDPEGSGQSAVGTQAPHAAPEPGRLVFVYRQTPSTHLAPAAASPSEASTYHKAAVQGRAALAPGRRPFGHTNSFIILTQTADNDLGKCGPRGGRKNQSPRFPYPLPNIHDRYPV